MSEVPEDFTVWTGGENPVPGKTVEYQTALCHSSCVHKDLSDKLHWPKRSGLTHITAYRVVE